VSPQSHPLTTHICLHSQVSEQIEPSLIQSERLYQPGNILYCTVQHMLESSTSSCHPFRVSRCVWQVRTRPHESMSKQTKQKMGRGGRLGSSKLKSIPVNATYIKPHLSFRLLGLAAPFADDHSSNLGQNRHCTGSSCDGGSRQLLPVRRLRTNHRKAFVGTSQSTPGRARNPLVDSFQFPSDLT
jgi:hypothetical protein